MKKTRLIYILLLSVVLSSCEDRIDLELDSGRSQLVVDAFLSNENSIQTIRLSRSADYFLNAPTPSENNAQVQVIGPGGKMFDFQSDGDGNFTYNPASNGALDSTGFKYQLRLTYNNAVYISYSTLNPVPTIDSMTVALEEEELGAEEGYYTQYYARDIPGRTDYYWTKAYKNGTTVYPEDPTFLILSVDAAFGGEGADGLPFILPIRAAITNEDEPFEVGDTSSVELFSLNETVYEYLDQVVVQSQDGGLFSTPTANIRSNILDVAGNTQEEVLGVFSLSAISRSQIVIK